MSVNSEALITKYIQLRDKVSELEQAHKDELKPYKAAMEKVELAFKTLMDDMGMDSVKTGAGTAYKSTKRSVTVADRESYLEYIRDSGNWDLLTVQANKTAVEEFRQEHDDIPPGLNWREEIVVNIRRS